MMSTCICIAAYDIKVAIAAPLTPMSIYMTNIQHIVKCTSIAIKQMKAYCLTFLKAWSILRWQSYKYMQKIPGSK